MKKLTFIALIALFMNTAHAIENHFHFEVKSSGPDIFACDAGIKHKNPSGTVGHGDNGWSYTNTSDQGDYLQDALKGTFKKYDQWADAYFGQFHVDKRATGSNSYNALRHNQSLGSLTANLALHRDGNGNNIEMTMLDVELSSERYGSAYYVDVCYYGPQFMSDSLGVEFIGETAYTVTNTYNKDYISQAGVMARQTMTCLSNNGGSVFVVFSTNWAPVTPGAMTTTWAGQVAVQAPKKCIVRYEFKESETTQRPNAKHGAVVKLWTEITDPSSVN